MAVRLAVAARSARAPRCVLVAAAPAAEAGRSLLERRLAALGAAATQPVAAASSRRPAAGEPRRARVRRRSPTCGTQRPVRAHVGRPRNGRLGVDVRDRRRAQPAGRCTGRRSRVRRGPAEGRTDGPRRLLRLRGVDRSADDRTQGARRRDRVPHDRARHRHRRGDAEGDRRHRRGEPERPTGRRRSRGRATARVGGGARRHRLRAGHRRASDRRREQPRDRAARCRAVRGRAGRSRVHDRLRNGKPRRAFLHASPTRRPRLRRPVRRVRRRGRRVRRRLRRGFRGRADLPTLQAVAKQTGGTFHNAEDADQLREVFADLPKDVATQKQPTEITWLLAALGALLAAAAIAASMRWSPYP